MLSGGYHPVVFPRLPRRSVLLALAFVGAACNANTEDASAPTKDAPAPIEGSPTTPAESPVAPPPSSPRTVPSATADVGRLLASIGDGPAIAVVARPRQWEAARATLTGLLGPGLPRELAGLSKAKTVNELLTEIGVSIVGLDLSKLRGIDPQRPWVAGFAEPTGPTSLRLPPVDAAEEELRGLGLRHVVLVPVTDANAFIDSLQPTFASEVTPLPSWAGGDGPSFTGRLGPDTFLVATAADGYARIVLFTQVSGYTAEEAKAALQPRIAATASPLAATPALRELTQRESLLAVHVRPWRLRTLAVLSGRQNLLQALGNVPADQRATALAYGLSIVLTAELVMLDESLELDDWGWMLEADGSQANLLGVGSLTEHGAKVFDAVQTDVTPLPSAAAAPAALEGFVRLDVAKGLAATPPHRMLATMGASESAQTFAECGPFCLTHALHRTPLQLVSTAAKWDSATASGLPAVLAVQGILPSFDAQSGGVAIITPTPADAKAARGWLTKTIGGEVERLGQLDEVTRGGQAALRMGIDAKPSDLFALAERKTSALLWVRAQGKGQGATPLGPALESLVGVAQLKRTGKTLVAQVAVASGEPKVDYTPDTEPLSWASPIRSRPGSGDNKCVADAALGIRKLFGALATIAADERGPTMTRGIAELQELFKCAGGNPSAKAGAKELETVVAALSKWFTTG